MQVSRWVETQAQVSGSHMQVFHLFDTQVLDTHLLQVSRWFDY
jgi:hypothetical protein